MHTQANDSCDTSDHCSLHRDFLTTVLNATEVKAKLEKENAMLKDRIQELSDDNSKLNQKLTEKEIQLESMMARVAEVDLLEFKSASNLKLLEATEARFAEERKHFRQQIHDLTNKDQPSPSSQESKDGMPASTADSPPVPSYSDVVRWSKVPPRRCASAKPVQTSPVPTSNRFAELNVEESVHEESATKNAQESSSPPKPPATQTGVHQAKDSKFKRGSEKPKIHLFGDSIFLMMLRTLISQMRTRSSLTSKPTTSNRILRMLFVKSIGNCFNVSNLRPRIHVMWHFHQSSKELIDLNLHPSWIM